MKTKSLSIGLACPLTSADMGRLHAKIRELSPSGRSEIISLQDGETLPSQCTVYFAADTPPQGIEDHPSLVWIQACSAGPDEYQSLVNIRRGNVVLTSASGIYSVHIAEFVLAAMINLSRRMPDLWSLMKARTWPVPRGHLSGPPLRGRRVAILGYGSIGREVGRMAHAMGMSIIAITNRSGAHRYKGFQPSPDIGDREGQLPIAWYPSQELPTAVATVDFLVIACPLTVATRGIVNRAVLGAMKPSACIINIARGAIIDFDSLRDALQKEKIAGAALDVHLTEPLPPDDPVFDLPHVQITPHMSGVMSPEDQSRLLCDVYLENLTRFVNGEELLNRVEPT